jgi:hypothetical protein
MEDDVDVKSKIVQLADDLIVALLAGDWKHALSPKERQEPLFPVVWRAAMAAAESRIALDAELDDGRPDKEVFAEHKKQFDRLYVAIALFEMLLRGVRFEAFDGYVQPQPGAEVSDLELKVLRQFRKEAAEVFSELTAAAAHGRGPLNINYRREKS